MGCAHDKHGRECDLDGPLVPNCPQNEPKGRFVAVEALERAVVEVREPQKAMGQGGRWVDGTST
jgi:hypothetical protein